jgi:NADH:ubiquinone reductase (H+-translocating)
VHIFYLIGFRNRFIVMAEWAWVYLWNERGARLITGDVEPLLERSRREAVEGRSGRNNQTTAIRVRVVQ